MSHHYILKRSFVFIADFHYDSLAIKEKATRYINRFFDSLNLEDQFGFISLGDNSKNLEIILEEKWKNPYVKKLILESLDEDDPDLTQKEIQYYGKDNLETALNKALAWQQAIENKTKLINNHTYFGPHKWIVCLIGSDEHKVGNFLSK